MSFGHKVKSFFGWLNLGSIILYAFFIFPPALAYWHGFTIGDLVLWLTGIAVVFYAIETQRMRLELVRQNEMAVQPLVTATTGVQEFRGIAPGSYTFVALKNIGRGPALFLQAEDIELSDNEGRDYRIRFKSIDHLTGDESKELTVDAKLTNRSGDLDPRFGSALWLLEHFDPHYAQKTFKLIVSYEDISRRKHMSVIQMGKDGIRFLGHGKQIRV